MKKNRVMMTAMLCLSLVAVSVTAQRPNRPCPKPAGEPCPQECPQICPSERNQAGPGRCAERPAEIYSPETRAMMRADRLAAELELSDDVKQKLVELFTKEENAKDEHRTAMAEQRTKQREAWQAEMERYNAEMEKIIGSENMQKLQQIRKKKAPEHPLRHENCSWSRQECTNTPK